jgi:hypothetical protein
VLLGDADVEEAVGVRLLKVPIEVPDGIAAVMPTTRSSVSAIFTSVSAKTSW